MRTFICVIAAVVLITSSCKKDNKKDNDQQQIAGPFSIYGEASCEGSRPLLLADYTYGAAGQKVVKSVYDRDHWNPEFFVMKAAGSGMIVFSVQDYANDTTYWVWYEGEATVPCTFAESGCKLINLQAFENLADVTAAKFIFKITYDNPGGTRIESQGGWSLYYGEGKQRSNGACNRLMGAFLAMNAPCKEYFEGEQPWDYCFKTNWYFTKP